jgi:hypothetical protein
MHTRPFFFAWSCDGSIACALPLPPAGKVAVFTAAELQRIRQDYQALYEQTEIETGWRKARDFQAVRVCMRVCVCACIRP